MNIKIKNNNTNNIIKCNNIIKIILNTINKLNNKIINHLIIY